MPQIQTGIGLGINRNQLGAKLNLTSPSDVILTPLSESSIRVDFTINDIRATSHSIERSVDGITYSQVATVGGTTSTFTDTGLLKGVRYFYNVKALKGSSYSQYSCYKNILVLGNSITYFPVMNDTWWGLWGMAASRQENDFVHKLQTKLRAINPSVVVKGIFTPSWEASHATYDYSLLDTYFESNPDCVIIRLGENITNEVGLATSYQSLIDYIKLKVPTARIVIGGSFMTNDAHDEIFFNAAMVNGLPYTELSSLFTTQGKSSIGTTVYDAEGNPHIINDAGVATHPSDFGMYGIADKLYDIVLPSTKTVSDLVMVFDTELSGSATKTIVIPATGSGYNFNIEWESEVTENYSGTVGNITHVYPTAGIKTIKISGEFPRINFNGGGDCLKLIDITNWGNNVWKSLETAFTGCSNLVCTATDSPDLSQVINAFSAFAVCPKFNGDLSKSKTPLLKNMAYAFYGCAVFNKDISGWDVSNVENMAQAFRDCALFDQDISIWNVSKVSDFSNMFRNCQAFNQDISGWDVSSAVNMDSMFNYCVLNQNLGAWNIANLLTAEYMFHDSPLSTANYDALLIGWASQSAQSNVKFNATYTKYSAGVATTARGALVNTYGWIIVDAGQV